MKVFLLFIIVCLDMQSSAVSSVSDYSAMILLDISQKCRNYTCPLVHKMGLDNNPWTGFHSL